jgi:ABC-type transporter MlaC component
VGRPIEGAPDRPPIREQALSVNLRRLGRRTALRLSLALATSSGSAVAEDLGSVAFVTAFVRDVSLQLGPNIIDDPERKRRFADLIDQGFDLNEIGSHLLGWRWAASEPSTRLAFGQAFRDYVVQTFALRVTGLDSRGMTIEHVAEDSRTSLVYSHVTTGGGSQMPIVWALVRTDAGWRLWDVIVYHLSIATILRSQFDAVLGGARSDIGPLLRLLREKSLG